MALSTGSFAVTDSLPERHKEEEAMGNYNLLEKYETFLGTRSSFRLFCCWRVGSSWRQTLLTQEKQRLGHLVEVNWEPGESLLY